MTTVTPIATIRCAGYTLHVSRDVAEMAGYPAYVDGATTARDERSVRRLMRSLAEHAARNLAAVHHLSEIHGPDANAIVLRAIELAEVERSELIAERTALVEARARHDEQKAAGLSLAQTRALTRRD